VSLLDLILAQKGILLSAGIAALLLVTAIMLSAVGRIRRSLAQRAQRVRQAVAALEQVEVEQQQPDNSPVQPVEQAQTTPASSLPQVAPSSVKPVLPAQAESATAQENTDDQQNQGPASAMQDILSSVFSDEEDSARQEALMKGLDTVGISDLLRLTNSVADELREHSQANQQGA
jgi:cell division protein FtsL